MVCHDTPRGKKNGELGEEDRGRLSHGIEDFLTHRNEDAAELSEPVRPY